MGTSANDFLNAGFVKKGSEMAAIVESVWVRVYVCSGRMNGLCVCVDGRKVVEYELSRQL